MTRLDDLLKRLELWESQGQTRRGRGVFAPVSREGGSFAMSLWTPIYLYIAACFTRMSPAFD